MDKIRTKPVSGSFEESGKTDQDGFNTEKGNSEEDAEDRRQKKIIGCGAAKKKRN